MKLWITCGLLLAMTAPVALAGPPAADDLFTPPNAWELLQDGLDQDWAGVWDMRVALVDCETDLELFVQTVRDTLCPNDSVEPTDIDGNEDFTCSGTYSDTAIEFDCESMFEVAEGCTATATWNYTGSRSGDEFNAMVSIETIYEGEGCTGFEPTCLRTEIQGTRVGPAPDGACATTPVEPVRWGAIKSRY